ncbi:MAG: argininosuccinate lyase [Myxococcales bacterium]|nr:argininosuccinate lyase [Myxococcales bacterium]
MGAPSSGKLWGGRFAEGTDALVERINASVGFDQRLYREDLAGSVAHVRMLAEAAIITADDASAIEAGLRTVRADIDAGRFEWRIDREDVHLNVEAALADRIGSVAGRLHTGRSRNDQVALDLRLYLREAFLNRATDALDLAAVLLEQANDKAHVVLPGYTHLQRAQPVSLAHHLHAYVAMLLRDAGRLLDAHDRANRLPLGSGALAGTPHPIRRERVATELGFPELTENSLDAVSDRDAAVEFLSAAALASSHLSRMGEELVLWMSQEFRFVQLPDAFCTGSSIMPQKKNPDIPELVRSKTGRITGSLVSLLMTLKGLPLAYNKDLQEDKEPLFDADDTLRDILTVMARLLAGARFDAERMKGALRAGFVMATDVADALVAAGVPFRDAHHRVGALVQTCARRGTELESLTPAEWHELMPELDAAAIARALDPVVSLERRDQPGSPAPKRVQAAQATFEARVLEARARVDRTRSRTELCEWMRSPAT